MPKRPAAAAKVSAVPPGEIRFRCLLPPDQPGQRGSVRFTWDGASAELSRQRDGSFGVRISGVEPGAHVCGWMIGGGSFWQWKVELDVGGPKPIRRHGMIPMTDSIVDRRDVKIDVPDRTAVVT